MDQNQIDWNERARCVLGVALAKHDARARLLACLLPDVARALEEAYNEGSVMTGNKVKALLDGKLPEVRYIGPIG